MTAIENTTETAYAVVRRELDPAATLETQKKTQKKTQNTVAEGEHGAVV